MENDTLAPIVDDDCVGDATSPLGEAGCAAVVLLRGDTDHPRKAGGVTQTDADGDLATVGRCTSGTEASPSASASLSCRSPAKQLSNCASCEDHQSPSASAERSATVSIRRGVGTRGRREGVRELTDARLRKWNVTLQSCTVCLLIAQKRTVRFLFFEAPFSAFF